MAHPKQNIAVIGTGYWGKNLVRNFAELGVLHTICDHATDLLSPLQEQFKIKAVSTRFDEVIQSPEIRAVVIATPAATHYTLAKTAILAGKDVFVEKPLALDIHEAEELIALADKHKAILMVDHLLHYHPGIIALKDLIDGGRLGKLLYVYSNRLNIGRVRQTENILWSFAPHDISVMLKLIEKEPLQVRVFGEAYVQDTVYDTTITQLNFGDRLKAHIYVSWLHPFKEQKLVVIGNYGMAVFNDVVADEKLTFYPHKIEWIKQIPVANKARQEVIPLAKKEPLREACQHFCGCVASRTPPQTDGQEALAVLKVLSAAQESIEQEQQHVA